MYIKGNNFGGKDYRIYRVFGQNLGKSILQNSLKRETRENFFTRKSLPLKIENKTSSTRDPRNQGINKPND